jgi:ribosomal protein S18 acetylase RimI-like enzyme
MPRVATEADQHAVRNLACMLAFQEAAAAAEIPNIVFVSEVDGKIVGFVAIDKRDAYTVKLTHVYVSGGFRGAWIGEALCRAAIESLNTGVEIGVLVSATNAAALALF